MVLPTSGRLGAGWRKRRIVRGCKKQLISVQGDRETRRVLTRFEAV